MVHNRSVPTNVILVHLTYVNLSAAIVWLTTVFGFEEYLRYGSGDTGAAQLHLGEAWIMVNGLSPGSTSPAQLGQRTGSLTVFVEDVDGHFVRVRAAGAKIVEHVHETEYGEYQY